MQVWTPFLRTRLCDVKSSALVRSLFRDRTVACRTETPEGRMVQSPRAHMTVRRPETLYAVESLFTTTGARTLYAVESLFTTTGARTARNAADQRLMDPADEPPRPRRSGHAIRAAANSSWRRRQTIGVLMLPRRSRAARLGGPT
jgi:hypothetical protein